MMATLGGVQKLLLSNYNKLKDKLDFDQQESLNTTTLYHDWTKIEDAAIALFRYIMESQYSRILAGVTFCNGLDTADNVWPRVDCLVDEGNYPYELPDGNTRADLKVLIRSNVNEPNAKKKHQQRASAIIDICWIEDPLTFFLKLDAVENLSIQHWHPMHFRRYGDNKLGELVTELHIDVDAAPSDVPVNALSQ
jgi:hypothetical protein